MLKSKKTILGFALCAITAICLTLGIFPGISTSQTVYALGTEEHNHTGWTGIIELPTVAGDYYLTDNITLSETWEVPAGITNLCLNGYVINANGGNFSVITVGTGATLNLYDCDLDKETPTTHNGYVDENGLWHLGEGEGTAKTITGGIIIGGNTENNGGGVNNSGTLNIYGGNVVGNTAKNGGGVDNSGTFNFYGGNIAYNVATSNGGGVNNSTGTFTMTGGIVTENTAINGGGLYSDIDIAINILTGGIVTENTAINGGGLYYKAAECFATGTLITMEDGTQKPIETLCKGESVRVFDHESGTVSSSKLFDIWKYPEKHSNIVELLFSHNVKVTVVYGHSFFEKEQNKYVSVTKDNVSSFIGHKFYNVDNARWETLEGYNLIDGEVDTYVITTEYQLNCVANGMLSNEDGFYTLLTNIFEYGDNLKIDQDKKAQDIANFGLYTYENVKHMSKYAYDVLNAQYMKVAFGKGMISESEFNYLEAYYASLDPELYCSDKQNEEIQRKKALMKAPLMSPLTSTPVSAPTTAGIYLGGSIKITNNISGNLYLCSGKILTIGTGTADGGNGVAAPTEDMLVGITLSDGEGIFTASGTESDLAYFFSDSNSFRVCFNAGTEEAGDEKLELKLLVAERLCPYCGGVGRSEYNCPICYGFKDSCCNWTGKALCEHCEGMGYIKYVSLKDAIDDISGNETIILLADNEEEIEISKVITFDIDAGDFTNDATFSTVDNYVIKISENEGVATYAIKKPVEFDSEYEWNDGEDITYGDTYSEISPKVYNNEVEVTELSFTFVYYQTTDGETWTKLEGVATDVGDYKVVISVIDATYCGSKEFTFTIGKAEQVITIMDPSKVYDRDFVYVNYNYLGDVSYANRKIEFKVYGESDDKYTENSPKYGGTYVVRVSLPECTNYLAGSATKEFTISKATIGTVGFADVTLPVAGETAETTVTGLAMDAKYTGTVTWSPSLVKGSFDYNTEYTATITLTITGDNNIKCYKFAENVSFRLKGKAPGVTNGWEISGDSTEDALILTKTFEKTEKIPQTVEITNVISKTYDKQAVSATTYTKLGEGTVTVEYKVFGAEDSTYTTNAPINAGKYVVRVSIGETDTHASSYDTAEFTIGKKAITVTIDSRTSIYGDEIVTLTATDDGIISGDENVYSLSTTASKTSNVGSYDITGEALDDNYSITFENEENAYTITQREVTLTWGETTFAYNGAEQLPTATAGNLANNDNVTVTVVPNKESVNVGEYVATATALSNDNYKLAETNLTKNFVINKADYDMTGITFTDKTVKTTDSLEDKKLAISGTLPTGLDGVQLSVSYVDNDNTERGVFTVTAKFSTTSTNYNTPSDMTAVLTILWVRDSEKESGSDNEFVIVTSETGIDPTLTLKVDVVKIDNNDSQYKGVADSIKKEDSFNAFLDKIFGVYDVSLIDQNDVKVQPDGTIKVYMTIPEEIKNCEFRIYHIHNGVASKADYVIDDGYAVIETDELSEFVFVYEQTSLLPWIIVLSVISALGLAGIVLFLVKNKKDKQGRK